MTDITTTTEIAEWMMGRIDFYGQVVEGSFDIDSSLEDLGLDSIYAMALLADIEDQYGVVLEPAVFQELTSIRQLSDAVAARLAAS